ncbi:hypothetical protein V1498_10890 [Peribacillus sp. SCS-26]|uniref:hypothetical protein n=1 Tax=Paraperibacillus marinus TaxID=3115295 RepID=UPI003905BA58
MKIEYRIAQIYIDDSSSMLYLVPVFDADYGIVEMDSYLQTNKNVSTEELEEITYKALELCYTKEPDMESPRVIQKV